MIPKEKNGPILVLNSGSSSLKFGLFLHSGADEEPSLFGSAEGMGHENGTLNIFGPGGTTLFFQEDFLGTQTEALETLSTIVRRHLRAEPIAVAHRIVHGGPLLREHQQITAAIFNRLEAAVQFAPRHLPSALKLVRKAEAIFAGSPHFACFDTAFHRTLSEVAARLPLPTRHHVQGVVRFGFHGLSYESLVYRLGADLPKRTILVHLGNGSSVTAVFEGKSIDTSIGLTPTGGVPMGTRTGDLDPGVLLYLLRTGAPDLDVLDSVHHQEKGLTGISGGESDMRDLERRAANGDLVADLAIEAFSIAIRKQIGAHAALLGGTDLLVFTGGIGEHCANVRNRICDGLGFLSLNNRIRVMKSEEEIQMARHCRALLERPS